MWPRWSAKCGLGARVGICLAATAFAGFLLVTVTGLGYQRSDTLERFDSSTNRLTGLLADNMVGSVRFGRAAGVEAAFAGLRQADAALVAVLVTDPKGDKILAWQRDGVAPATLTTALPKGVALLDAAGITTVEAQVRPSPDAAAFGTLRTVWSHQQLDASIVRAALRQAIIATASMLAMIALLYAALRHIAIHPLADMTAATVRLADGQLDVAVRGAARHDELGALARSLEVFRQHMLQERDLAAQQIDEQKLAEADKLEALRRMADAVETEIAAAIAHIGHGTDTLAETASAMSVSATETDASAQGAVLAASQALANIQTVASGAERLAASIGEIGNQVGRSTAIVGQAVQAGSETRSIIEALNEKVSRIGAVADMIGEIAARTNLLALNATIEAARAGDAGKGFAVVASEVKQLARQTAHSTAEITRHIEEVRAATGASVAAVGRIEQTISEVNTIAGAIAASVEKQETATAGIARNVAETANAANEMTSRTSEVSAEASKTGQRAGVLTDLVAALQSAVSNLTASITRVVRTATPEVDRRQAPRYAVDLPCRMSIAGRTAIPVRIVDLSDGGANLCTDEVVSPDTIGTLQIDGVNSPLPFVVRRYADGCLHVAFQTHAAAAGHLRAFIERQALRQAA